MTPETYVLEELSVARMKRVNDLCEYDALNNQFPTPEHHRNPMKMVHAYRCEMCEYQAHLVVVNVGTLPAIMDCLRCDGPAGQLLEDFTPTHEALFDGELDGEFFRPLTIKEIDACIEAIKARDPMCPTPILREALDSEATSLINGHLRYRTYGGVPLQAGSGYRASHQAPDGS